MGRLTVGVDVPWVTSWTGEEMLAPGPCLTVDGQLALMQADRPGRGRPQYSMNHLRRQRASVRGMLCPMCGQPTPPGNRWMQTATVTSAGAVRARSFGLVLPPGLEDGHPVLNAGSIAPSHRRCAELALDRCPHLGADPDPTLRRFPERWEIVPLMVAAGASLHVLARPEPQSAVAFLQLFGIL